MKELLIGAHVSASGGSFNAPFRGRDVGCKTIQIFTSNQKQWRPRKIDEEERDKWFDALEETGIQSVMSHDSYLINLGSNDPELLQKSRSAFRAEIERCQFLEIPLLNFHPGAARGATEGEALQRICDSINKFESLVKGGPTKLVLETTAGQGTSLGYSFEHLAFIIENTSKDIPLGVCIDTCHIFCAGYDIRTDSAWEETLEKFDRIIGLKYLSAFHLNDSRHPLGSRKDRHAGIGKGEIGLDAFSFLVRCEKTKHLPMYLETPDPELYQEELDLLRKCAYETTKN